VKKSPKQIKYHNKVLAKGSQATLLSPKLAQDAFPIQNMVVVCQQESGR
jgi:hypothetical protein